MISIKKMYIFCISVTIILIAYIMYNSYKPNTYTDGVYNVNNIYYSELTDEQTNSIIMTRSVYNVYEKLLWKYLKSENLGGVKTKERNILVRIDIPSNIDDTQFLSFNTRFQDYYVYADNNLIDVKTSTYNTHSKKKYTRILNTANIPLSSNLAGDSIYILLCAPNPILTGEINNIIIDDNIPTTIISNDMFYVVFNAIITLILFSISIVTILLIPEKAKQFVLLSMYFFSLTLFMFLQQSRVLMFEDRISSVPLLLSISLFICTTSALKLTSLAIENNKIKTTIKYIINIYFVYYIVTVFHLENIIIININQILNLYILLGLSTIFSFIVLLFSIKDFTPIKAYLLFIFSAFPIIFAFDIFSANNKLLYSLSPYVYTYIITSIFIYVIYIIQTISNLYKYDEIDDSSLNSNIYLDKLTYCTNNLSSNYSFDDLINATVNSFFCILGSDTSFAILKKEMQQQAKVLHTAGMYNSVAKYDLGISSDTIYDNFLITNIPYKISRNTCNIIINDSSTSAVICLLHREKPFTNLEIESIKILSSILIKSFNNANYFNEISNIQKDTILALVEFVDIKTHHSNNSYLVGEFTKLITEAIGYDKKVAINNCNAAYLCNIGLIFEEDEVIDLLSKTSIEDYSERLYIHAKLGYDILSKFDDDFMRTAAIFALEHHEHYDGTGFLGLKKLEISVEGRIIAGAIYLQQMYYTLSKQPYFTMSKLFVAIEDQSEKILDPLIVNIILNNRVHIENLIKNYYDNTYL